MSEANAELLAEAIKFCGGGWQRSGIGDAVELVERLADALERAEREHAERLDTLAAEITALRGEAERDERDYAEIAITEAVLRSALSEARALMSVSNEFAARVAVSRATLVLNTPPSLLAARYAAVVKAATRVREWLTAHNHYTKCGSEAGARLNDLRETLAALDHPTPGKKDADI